MKTENLATLFNSLVMLIYSHKKIQKTKIKIMPVHK